MGRRTAEPIRVQQLQKRIDELEIALREVHHRIRRQLQTIASLLSMQGDRSPDERVSNALADAALRILAIASIHDELHDHSGAAVDMRRAIRAVADLVQRTLGVSGQTVTVSFGPETFELPSSLAVPCGLVVNELVTNALQHAFKGRQDGVVEVQAGVHGGRATIVVSDTGIGFPLAAATTPPPGMGLDLVHMLVARQLRGEFVITRAGGTRCTVTFPCSTDAH